MLFNFCPFNFAASGLVPRSDAPLPNPKPAQADPGTAPEQHGQSQQERTPQTCISRLVMKYAKKKLELTLYQLLLVDFFFQS